MDKPDKDILRQVSLYEHNLKIYGNVVSRNKIVGKIPVNILQQALKIIAGRHPFLTAVFFEAAGSLYFKRMADFTVPLTVKEHILPEIEKDNYYREELNNLLDPYKQLWRVLFLLDCKADEINTNSHSELILTVYHSICDGISLLNLVNEILEQVQALQKGTLLYEDQKLSVMPPLDELALNFSKTKGIEADKHRSAQKEVKYDKIEPDFSVPEDKCRIDFLKGKLSGPETELLINKCRQYKITVHGILTAAALKAISEEIPKTIINDKLKDKILLINHPVDTRKKIANLPGKEYLTGYSTSETTVITINDRNSEIINLARIINSQLAENFLAYKGIKRLLKMIEANEVIERIELEKNQVVLWLTNAGKPDLSGIYEQFSLVETDFTASHKFPCLVLSVTTLNNVLGYLFIYTNPWFKYELIERICNHFKAYLSAFIYAA